ncbi:facilitated trehalose transporter Tret1-2 homolog isoform X2 [Pectinophora gossypiella]|nr:facilitated trehalose transporter Tret1-2 homolog isoform X2 [Pectinophora gossypiella]XP_049869097.1 facilitated trehalose transporter Tret1-2 homolog isoform X2 [Pectinophora gossypiella]XP_049869098.1 facilitated trehalose transporter Tret1-2 homolog isoform X2 [Pectinophora gossypiella]
MDVSNRKVQYLVALSVSTCALTMGLCSTWATPVNPKLMGNETDVDMDKDKIAWMLSMGPPGYMLGSLATGIIMDKIGRRATLLWSSLPYGVAMIIVATAVKFWLLYIVFFLWQFGTGMLGNVMTLYFTEISDKDIRGTLSLLTKIAFNFGSLLMMCIGPFLSYETLNMLLLFLPVLYLVVCWWIPESPYHYLKDGRVDAARKVLIKLRGYKDEKVLNDELLQMKQHVNSEMSRSTSPKELFTGRQYRKAIVIAVGLKITQIMTGAVTIQQYLGLIMEESAINMGRATLMIIFGSVKFLVSIMPSVLADKVGRRPLLIYSYLGTGISLATVGMYFFLMDVIRIEKNILSPYGIVTFIGIVSANIISTIGFNSLVMLIPGEIFPMNVKAAALTSLSIFAGFLSFIVARSYQPLKDSIGLCGVFWIFATIAFGGAVFSMLFVPETKGKSLKEIQVQLQGDMYDAVEAAAKLNHVENGADIASESKEMEVLNKKNNDS